MISATRMFEMIMVGAYALTGLLLLFTRALWDYVPVYREIWGGAFLLYAAYRGTVVWKRIQLDKQDSSQNKRT